MTLPTRLRALGLLLALFIFLLSVHPFAAQAAPAGEDEPTSTSKAVIRGRASWYGREHQGHATSNGERFSRFKYTCAHRSLPFGTRLRVTNPDNGKSVVVRVTDRGPFRNQRVLDLAEVAARPLNIVEHGAVDVIAEVVPEETPLGPTDAPADLADLLTADTTTTLAATKVAVSLPATTAPATLPTAKPSFLVQAGTFRDTRNAEALLAKIQALNPALAVTVTTETVADKTMNRVLVGQFNDWMSAEKVRRELLQRGITGLVRQIPASQATAVEQVAVK